MQKAAKIQTSLVITIVASLFLGAVGYAAATRLMDYKKVINETPQNSMQFTLNNNTKKASENNTETVYGYKLPINWEEKEESKFKHSTSAKEFVSNDGCNEIIVSKRASTLLSIKDYVSNEYKGENLSSLINKSQYKFDNLEAITVSSTGIGEVSTTYVKTSNSVYEIAVNSGGPEGSLNTKCQPVVTGLAQFIESFKFPN